MLKTRRQIFGMILAVLIIVAGAAPQFIKNAQPITMPESARAHILYGDARGGGHMAGAGKPCKSEFPKDWDGAKIINEAARIAANDNLNWRRQKNGYEAAEDFVDGVKVRVVVNARKQEVVTAYPVNVRRNPCPAANDNQRD